MIALIKLDFVVLLCPLIRDYYPAVQQMVWLNQEPFAIWQDRDLYRNINDLSVTEGDIGKAIYVNEKDPCRVMTLMNKVSRGEPIKMIVIGGSNSAGGGISDHRRLFHQLFSQWWSRVIFPTTGSKLTVKNLSLGGTGSDFFTFCLQNFMSKGEEPDIVLIELSVNDYGYLHGKTARPMELLTRRVLSLSSFPLVLYVSLVDLVQKGASFNSIKNPRCQNLEDLGQRELAAYYGITLLSWRDILCPIINETSRIREPNIRPGMVNRDHLHIDVKGHAQVALIMIRYFQNVSKRAFHKQLRRGVFYPWKCEAGMFESTDKITPLFVKVSSQTLSSNPLCWSLISTNFKKSDGTQSLKVKVMIQKGFHEIDPESKLAKMKFSRMGRRFGADRNDSFGAWRSRNGGNFIEFSFTAPKMAGKTNKWSVGLVLRRLRNGCIRVWLDENERNALTIMGKNYGRVLMQTRIYFLGTTINSGTHKMGIKTEGSKGFDVLLSGIVLGPPGIKDIKEYRPTNTLEKAWSYED